MKNKKLKILVIFDYPENLENGNYGHNIVFEDWMPNQNVIDSLVNTGYEVHLLGIHNKIDDLIFKVKSLKPDLVFNLVECFNSNRYFESHIVSLLELLDISYTGSSSLCLSLCQDKLLTKRMLSPLKIKTPKSLLFKKGAIRQKLHKLNFPLFVKPLGQEGSEGISQNSFCDTEQACLERVQFIHQNLKTHALVEEYIKGRELYASVIGSKQLKVLPLREMVFGEFPENRPKFATYKAKWDDKFKEKWGISYQFANDIDLTILKNIERISKNAFKALKLKGYGRLDLRLTDTNEIYVIEVNPNPSIAQDDELAQSAVRAGISYEKLIQKIVEWAELKKGY